jgi:hypothetical protein
MRSGFEIRRSALVLAIPLVATLAARSPPTLEDVLQRMHAYLEEYARQLPAMIATEEYEQHVALGDRRRLVSDSGRMQILERHGGRVCVRSCASTANR